ncbi:zinc-dependent alcohol dehydrogenase family protein [Microbacterium indicum]|uniref:zinc-dependent alcohol dehydrogenase family protein n=1 Tax=Microbacterium indicum TaxID=358100 RepID=UPI00048E264D|nr:zinc-dependent alcohol dehydrogenase family protein [Microbacterium indicum]
MRAVTYAAFSGPVEVSEVPRPEAPAHGVVVRVEATGLCRSDWHGWAGHDDDISLPHVPGHELAGVVAEVGAGVERWAVGDRVTVPFVNGCGSCEWCLRGDAQVCPDQTQPGFTHDGSFAELVALHAADANLVRIPDGVTFEAAAALGCRFATAYRGLVARARVEPGEWVAVVGAGGVGLSAVMIAQALGARLIAIDRSETALAAARELGAETVVSDDDATRRVSEITGGGAHVAVDAVGLDATCATAILSLRRRGRHVQIGLMPGTPRVPMGRVIAWEIDVLGSHGMSARDYPGMLAMIADGSLAPERLIERIIDLDEAARALPSMDTATPAGMTMIRP